MAITFGAPARQSPATPQPPQSRSAPPLAPVRREMPAPARVTPASVMQPVMAASSGAPLQITADDRSLVLALAAQQVRYGQPQEALALLMALRRLNPTDEEVLRLLVMASMKAKLWQEAETFLAELSALQRGGSRVTSLYRALVDFHFNRLSQARAWFSKFLSSPRE